MTDEPTAPKAKKPAASKSAASKPAEPTITPAEPSAPAPVPVPDAAASPAQDAAPEAPPVPPAPSAPAVYAQPGYAPPPPPPPTGAYTTTKPKTWMNWTALGCGIGGFFTCGLTSILAIIFGHLGRSAVKRGEADEPGVGLAGLILGYAPFVIAIVWISAVIVIGVSSS